MSETLMIIDIGQAQPSIADNMKDILPYAVNKARSFQEAIHQIHTGKQPQPSLILMCSGEAISGEYEFLRKIMEIKPQLPVIAVLPYGSDELAIQLIKAGASDYVTKPVTKARLKTTLDNVIKMQRLTSYKAWLERRIVGHVEFADIIGKNDKIKEALRLAHHGANSSVPVWIEGEPGCGKEWIARAIHGGSSRAGKPFVAINCAMLSEQAAELMLFGQDKGAHNAQQFVLGKIREAEGGTLFFDEVGSLKPSIQQRLLEMIRTDNITPAGASAAVKTNVRIMSSTSTPFDVLVAKNMFNPALYQKLKSLMIMMPALRQRKDDIPLLAEHFIAMHSAAEQKYIQGITPHAIEFLSQQFWPGNVHELANTIKRAILLCRGDMLDVIDIQTVTGSQPSNAHEKVVSVNGWLDAQGRMKPLKYVQEEAIRFALEYSNGCMTRAAKSLGIGRSTLYRKLEEFGREAYNSRANQTTRPIINVSNADRS